MMRQIRAWPEVNMCAGVNCRQQAIKLKTPPANCTGSVDVHFKQFVKTPRTHSARVSALFPRTGRGAAGSTVVVPSTPCGANCLSRQPQEKFYPSNAFTMPIHSASSCSGHTGLPARCTNMRHCPDRLPSDASRGEPMNPRRLHPAGRIRALAPNHSCHPTTIRQGPL